MKNILFCGLGSAGQRHLRILKKKISNAKFYCIRNTKRNILISDKLKTKQIKSLVKHYNLNEISFNDLDKIKFEFAVIASPINQHLNTALRLAKKKINLFIEKPISNNTKKINLLKKISYKNKIKIFVGYQLRYHPGIKILKRIIKRGDLGEVVSAFFKFGEYLPLMHKYEDYKNTHMAKKAEGGGPILCLSHEIDLVRYLIGNPKKIYSFTGKGGHLITDVEDYLSSILIYNKFKSIFLNVNFLTNPPKNEIEINFQNGTVYWNYFSNYIQIKKNSGKLKKIFYREFERNDMFTEQWNEFIKIIKKKSKNKSNIICNFNDSIETLNLCLKLNR